ncbi:MAG: hypothetical protein DRO93_15485, partial [Candidatus Thorarchaeota archaeon]
MGHNDQLNFEYYDKGDYLIADSGEVKERDVSYSPSAKCHNIVMVSNDAYSNPGGVVKGVGGDCYNPAIVQEFLDDNLFEFVEAEISNWQRIENTSNTGERRGTNFEYITLTNPLKWRRTILFPSKEYFIVLDYLNNSNQRLIYNTFHLTSFNSLGTQIFENKTDIIVNSTQAPTHRINVTSKNSIGVDMRTYFKDITGSGDVAIYLNGNLIDTVKVSSGNHFVRGINDSYMVIGINNVTFNTTDNISFTVDYTRLYDVGIVNGSLEIEGSYVNWTYQTIQEEVNIANGSELKWNTTNINNQKIQMHLYSIPESEISVERYWTRIGGYDQDSNIDHPLIRFKLNT